MKISNEKLTKKIEYYGRDILSSKQYKRAFAEKHHFNSSVGEHSISVAKETIKICGFLSRHGIKVDERKAVRAALLHDLGMLGRRNKFSSQYETSRRHPIDSLAVAKEFEPDLDDVMTQAIARHMFPIFSKPPTKPEAIAVCIADKVASVKELF